MEERTHEPGKFSGLDRLLVDRAIGDPFAMIPGDNVRTHSFDDGQSSGYIRYTLKFNTLTIIDCVITRTRPV
jgi:hypothetical protein